MAAYICGEETALLDSLEGKKGSRASSRRSGELWALWQATTITNTETFAAVPWIVRNGGRRIPRVRPAEQRRHQAFSCDGARCPPGNYEVSWGCRSRSCSRWPAHGRRAQAEGRSSPGGSSMPVLPADLMMKTDMDLRLDRQRRARCSAPAP